MTHYSSCGYHDTVSCQNIPLQCDTQCVYMYVCMHIYMYVVSVCLCTCAYSALRVHVA